MHFILKHCIYSESDHVCLYYADLPYNLYKYCEDLLCNKYIYILTSLFVFSTFVYQQTVNKVGPNALSACKGGRFFGSGAGCCDDSCAAGCTGTTSDECFACKNVNNDGKCQDFCPNEEKFVTSGNTISLNPNFRVEAGDYCLRQCPVDFFEKGRLCVTDCGQGNSLENGRCEQCVGPCPGGVECVGWGGNAAVNTPSDPVFQNFINSNCTIVNGNIRFNSITSENVENGMLTLEHLRRFEHVKVIRGALDIQSWKPTLPLLDFFKNVEYIGSQNFSLDTISASDAALSVFVNGNTTRIDLSRLRLVRTGRVLMTGNPGLCYFGDFTTSLSSIYLADPSTQVVRKINYPFSPPENCENKTCHSECVQERRCWGPNDTNCVLCLNFRYEQEWKCVPDCSVDSDTYEDSSLTLRSYKYCASCDVECIGCTGAGPFLCKACRNFEIRFRNGSRKCVPSCPTGYYNDGTRQCKPCHPLCVGGCSGPQGYVGNGGCNACEFVSFNATEAELPELDDSSIVNWCLGKCTLSMYQTLLVSSVGAVERNNKACFECDKQCSSCNGPNSTDCCTPVDGSCISVGAQTNFLESTSPWPIIGGILGALLALVVLALLLILAFFLHRRRRRSLVKYGEEEVIGVTNEMYGTLDDISEQILPVPRVQPNLSKIVITPVDSLMFEEKLGSGAFGTVHKGQWTPPGEGTQYTVAIKVLNDDTPPTATQELLDEGVAMASMDHPYIVRLYAMSMGENLMLVTQFLPMGSLLHFLRKYKSELNAYHLLTYGQQIAEGMAYLEDQRMVHRDLAARNVLVQTSSKVKIADFGLSKCLEVGESGYKAGKGKVPVRWLAPECLRRREFSHKSDVWAFGVTMWEVLTFGAKPYGKKKAQEVLTLIEKGERLPQPATCSDILFNHLLKCWEKGPADRPPFAVLSTTFRQMCEYPQKHVSTTKDGALDSYTDLPTNESTVTGRTDYEYIDEMPPAYNGNEYQIIPDVPKPNSKEAQADEGYQIVDDVSEYSEIHENGHSGENHADLRKAEQ
jgi:L1 cell adhesion molecule